MAEFFWPAIGVGTGGVVLAGFGWALAQRRWTGRAIYVSLGCLAIALLHMVAPFRGTLDPDYPGYSFGLISLDGGPLVGAVAGAFYLLAGAACVIAADNRKGPAMWIVAILSGIVLLTLGGYLAGGLLGLQPPYRIELGHYLQLSPLPATMIAFLVMLLPFTVGLPWSVRNALASRES